MAEAAMMSVGVGLVLVLLIAVAALVMGVLSWQRPSGRSCCGARTSSAVATGKTAGASAQVVIEIVGTGATDTEDSGFQTILSSHICTSKCENRLAAIVSATSDIALSFIAPTGGAFFTDIAQIEMRVLVDGVAASPGTVTWNSMSRQVFLDPDSPGGLLDSITTTEANSFTFIQPRICPGCHLVEVQARGVATADLTGVGVAAALAVIGNRSLLVIASKDASCSPSSSSSSCTCAASSSSSCSSSSSSSASCSSSSSSSC